MRLAWLAVGMAAVTGAVGSEYDVPAGERLLAYLHSRGEALGITAPRPIVGTYIDWREVDWAAPQNTVNAAVAGGFNLVILAFLLTNGPTDMLQAWAGVDNATRAATIAAAHAQGAVVMLTAGGSTETPLSGDPATYGHAVGAAVGALGLDGADFDIENLSPGFTYGDMTGAQVVDWLVAASVAARGAMGPSALLTHAPQAPYFSGPWTGPCGGYSAVWTGAAAAGAHMSWFNAQFYNQGAGCYVSYDSLFVNSTAGGDGCTFPGTAVAQIVSSGMPLGAIVVGKPLTATDAGSGWVSGSDLGSWVARAGSDLAWSAGVFCWSWEVTQGPSWVRAVFPK